MSENQKISWIFLSPRGVSVPKIIRPELNSNLTCVSRVILTTHLHSKFQLKMFLLNRDNEGKLKIIVTETEKSKGHNSVENCSTVTKFESDLS